MNVRIGTLCMMAATAVSPLCAEPLEKAFRDPPREAGVWVWWHWQGNNVTREGITLDLEAMRDSGVAGATIFTIAEHAGLGVLSNKVNAAMAYRNAAWWDAVTFAVDEAARLGLKIGMHNSPGFSVTGGPWIDPAHAMQKVVWTKRAVPGGEILKGAALKRPWANLGFFRDIAVLAVPDGNPVSADDILDVTSLFRDGARDWQAPVGRSWTVYRFGYTPTGQRTHPVPDEIRKTCLETDKLSREATELHIREGLDPLKARLGRHWGKTFVQITVDSYEAGKQNWSPRFRADFRELAGYDPVPFLPALDGRTVASASRTRRFKADMDFVVRRLFARNYHEILHDWTRRTGVELHLEPYGGPFDPFEAAAACDVPMVEFWNGVPTWLGNKPWLYGGFPGIPGAVGRALGRDVVASEAFTGGPGVSRWTEAPRDFKRSGDAALARGINRLVLHHWVHQPFGNEVRPGLSMGFWGSHFGRTQTWHRPARAFYRYWARCQALLQQGKAVVPVLTVGIDRDLSVQASETDMLSLSMFLREGYARVDGDGRIVLPSGRRYPVLRVPRTGGLRPETASNVIARTCGLIRAGSTVWGDFTPPAGAKGRVLAGDRPRAEVLAAVGVRPAVEIASKNLDALTAERYVLSGARETDETRFFFIACGHTNAVALAATFDAGARVPEVWNPETGAMQEASAWRALPDGRTQVDLEMAPDDALFVVFRRTSQGRRGASRPPRPFTACREIAGPWRVCFAPGGGAPKGVQDWPELQSWSESQDPGVRFHSGEAVYEAAFDLTAEEVADAEFRLDLGRVEVIAEAELNGVALGTAWRPPYRLSATAGVRAGRNTLRVRVTNTWKNRLLGDRREPTDLAYGDETSLPDWGWIAKAKPGRGVSRFPDWLLKGVPRPARGRVAVPLWDYYADGGLPEKTLALAPSGLLGPVRIDSRAVPSPVVE